MDWSKDGEKLVSVGLSLGLGFGIMGYILGEFVTSLPVNSVGANFSNYVLTAFINPLKTIFPVVITIIFVILIYVVAKKSGIMGNTKTGRGD